MDNYKKTLKLHTVSKGNHEVVDVEWKLGNALQTNLVVNNVHISPETTEDAIAIQQWITEWILVNGKTFK